MSTYRCERATRRLPAPKNKGPPRCCPVSRERAAFTECRFERDESRSEPRLYVWCGYLTTPFGALFCERPSGRSSSVQLPPPYGLRGTCGRPFGLAAAEGGPSQRSPATPEGPQARKGDCPPAAGAACCPSSEDESADAPSRKRKGPGSRERTGPISLSAEAGSDHLTW